jgi:predicted aminopeptidase
VKSAYSQADLLRRRVPVEEALKDPRLTAEQKRKLKLAQDARKFAEETLGLATTQNYTSYVQLDRPYVTYVVSAAPKNILEPYLWKYPIVGSLPYQGFFDPKGADALASQMRSENFDVFVRGVSAFSTLGWFRDPILSSMLEYRDYDLVNTIIHETTHATIFIKSEADFNETLASFFGNQGAVLFYEQREGLGSPTVLDMHKDAKDEARFSDFIAKEIAQLKDYYTAHENRVIPEEERKARLKEIQTRFITEVQPTMELKDSYRGFAKNEINNARLLTYHLYMKDMSDFETVFAKLGHDFKRMLAFCKTLQKEDDPKAALAQAARAP